MQLSKKLIKIAIGLLLLIAPPVWLISTNSGLNTTLSIARIVSPVKFNYGAAKGSLIGGPIKISDLELEYEGETLQIADFTINWRSRNFLAKNVQGIAKFIPNSHLLADPQLSLSKLQGSLQQSKWKFELLGKSANAIINGEAHLNSLSDIGDLEYLDLTIGKNHVVVKQNQSDGFFWDLKILEPQVIFANAQGNLNAKGSIKNIHSALNISAAIDSKSLIVNQYHIKNLQGDVIIGEDLNAPLKVNLKCGFILIDQQKIKDFKLAIAGTRMKHTIQANANYDGNKLTLKSNAKIEDKIWHSDPLALNINDQAFKGHMSYEVHSSALKLAMHSVDSDNHLQAQFNINRKLNGDMKLIANNIDFLMQWMPEVTRLKGKFIATAKVSGSVDKPVVLANAHLTEVTATLPAYGVKIKPLELHLDGDAKGKFTVRGTGQMRRGSGRFTLNGYIEPFKENMPNALNIVGDDIEFINNATAHLIASNKIQVNYIPNDKRIDVTGDIEIKEGHITIQERSSSSHTVKTKDVVYVDQKTHTQDTLKINPHINIRIVEGVKFTGFGLYANISGKVNITRRNNIAYADGRITIKEGTFQLPGQQLVIQKGRILYPPGTSLTNPVLDIKMHGKSSTQESIQGANHDVELSVQGTAHKPVIHESGLTGKQDRAISRALVTGSGMLSRNLVQEKLKITEIGLSGNDDPNVTFFNAPAKGNTLKNKALVVGRPLGKKFYVQYLHSISEANQKVRLKYALSDIWAIGVESGTQGGGADLSFSFER